jgi:cupin 2 domain-containing protein
MDTSNIYSDIPKHIPNELIERVFQSESLRIERIISYGQSSPKDFWYDQEENEWVILLKGKAILKFNNNSSVELQEGDYLFIPAHKKHRVEWTDTNKKTIWLAVFFK